MVEITNRTRVRVNEAMLHRVALRVLKAEGRGGMNLSIALVGPKRARELKRIYRKEDRAANVLAFPMPELGLGEVTLCPHEIKKDAKTYGMTLEKTLAFMLVHGILHLLGYTHTHMEQKEKRYLERFA